MAVEKSLWGEEDKRTEVELSIPSDMELRRLSDPLTKYTLGELQEMCSPYYSYGKRHRFFALDNRGKKYYPSVTEKIFNGGKLLKKDWINFLATMQYFLNFLTFFEELPKEEQQLFRLVLTKHYVSENVAKKILGREVTMRAKYGWGYEPKGNLKLWYKLTSSKSMPEDDRYGMFYRPRVNYLELKDNMYQEYLPIFYREMRNIPVLKEIPDEEKDSLTTYSGEDFIYMALPILQTLHESKQIEFGKSKVVATSIKKAAKMLNMKEFFLHGDKGTSLLAAADLINSYCLYYVLHSKKKTRTKPEDLIKDILINNDQQDNILVPLLLPHFTGFLKNYMRGTQARRLIYNIISSLKLHKDKGWVDVNKLCLQIRMLSWGSESSFLMLDSYSFEPMQLVNGFTQHEIFLDNMIVELIHPFIKSYLFMMASLGLVEIAYREVTAEKDNAVSCYDGLRFVRLTNLGKYALGLTNQYVRTKTADVTYFELDKESLIVKSLIDANPYESILCNMAEHISKKMYKVTPESFLKDCNTKKDIENKIALFKDYICDAPPANWKAFFKQMLDRCNPMIKPKKKYLLLQLPAENKELQRIVLSDPNIRKYILKAEDYHILVEQDNYKKFCDILKKYGYLL